ncbi:hypothetical protein LOTGIDRAFT_235653 [Lottia gigantea]|uniref:CUB domain-containing protein n=1 Tax=Lottia gigantea TaxID=225164 RepID=V4BAT1_LOTGI|nr:hypothetical protein LOTGIDRAFT_235653 [Lottia gigantea]ESO86079.1 hypothetical protein LOTGIDRAFT_235653 [Lottia gigantea]
MKECDTRMMRIAVLFLVFETTIVSCNTYGRTVELWASAIPRSIFSDHYPADYDSFSDSRWLIRSSNVSESIKIEVQYMDVEYGVTCRYDKLAFYDGSTVGAHVLATLCGNYKPIIVSSTSSILIHFTSDWGIQGRGFHLRYSAVFGVPSGYFPESSTTSMPNASGRDEEDNFLDKYQGVATIVGASIGGIVIAVVLIYIIWLSCYTFYNKTNTTRPTNRCAPTPELYHTPASGDFCSYPVGPPSYEFAVPTSPPPPYEEVDPNPRPRSFLHRLLEIGMNVRRPRRHVRPRPVRPLSAVTHRSTVFSGRNASLFSNVRMTNGSQPSCIIVTEAEDGTIVDCLTRESIRQTRSPRRGSSHHSPTRSPTRRLSEAQARRLSESPTRRPYRSTTNRSNHSPTRRLSQSPTRRLNQSPTRRHSRPYNTSQRNQILDSNIPLPTIHDANNNSADVPTRQNLVQNTEQRSEPQMAENVTDGVSCIDLPLTLTSSTAQDDCGSNVELPILQVTADGIIESTDV